jgi:hypothetical protein
MNLERRSSPAKFRPKRAVMAVRPLAHPRQATALVSMAMVIAAETVVVGIEPRRHALAPIRT